jgi:predicted NUDIX family phosphoesterase
MKKLIMVVPRDILFDDNDAFNGFMPTEITDFKKKILGNFHYMEKTLAEEDPRYKQPIAYAIIFNREKQQIFIYKRSKQDKNYKEKRLQGKWSIGVGGHIEETDTSHDPIVESLLREIKEEIGIDVENPKLLGYINDDTNPVGKVHFGMVYIIETSENIIPKDPEIEIGQMLTIGQIQTIQKNDVMESWSTIIIDPIKEYII